MFLHDNDFSLYIEQLKVQKQFDTYIETVIYYVENESDKEYSNIVRNLNKKIIQSIEREASELKLLKDNIEYCAL